MYYLCTYMRRVQHVPCSLTTAKTHCRGRAAICADTECVWSLATSSPSCAAAAPPNSPARAHQQRKDQLGCLSGCTNGPPLCEDQQSPADRSPGGPTPGEGSAMTVQLVFVPFIIADSAVLFSILFPQAASPCRCSVQCYQANTLLLTRVLL